MKEKREALERELMVTSEKVLYIVVGSPAVVACPFVVCRRPCL